MPRLSPGGIPSARVKRRNADNGLRLATALTVISLVLFTMGSREGGSGPLTAVRGGFQIVTTPVSYVGSLISVPFQGIGNIASNLTADQETLSELRAKNAELTARNAELEEAQQTAKRLQSLLKLQDSYSLQSTAARIISGSTDSWNSTVTIDKGTLSGITVGMPVTDANGIIGQTIECGPTSSTVRLLDDEKSSVSAMIQKTRAQGMLKGSADGTLHLTMIGTDQTVEVGDIVVTSGLGGVFPKGLPMGTVSNVSKTSGKLYYDIEVGALSTTENNEEVLVITSLTEGQEASSEDIAAADAQDTQQSESGSSDEGAGSSASGADGQESDDQSDEG